MIEEKEITTISQSIVEKEKLNVNNSENNNCVATVANIQQKLKEKIELGCDITIASRSETIKLLEVQKYDAIISIGDPAESMQQEQNNYAWKKRLQKNCDTLLTLYFYDTSDTYVTDCPKLYHVAQIREIAHLLKQKKVLIHCKAGISRSTAAAVIILVEQGCSFEKAMQHICKIRPIASPNVHMLFMFQKFILKKDSLLLSDEIRKEIFLLPVPPPQTSATKLITLPSSSTTTSTSSLDSLDEKEQQKTIQKQQPRLSPLATNSLSASSMLKKSDSTFPIESEIYPEAHRMQKSINQHQKNFKEPYDYNLIIDYQTESVSSIEQRKLKELKCEQNEQKFDRLDKDSGRVIPIIIETIIKNDLKSFKAFAKIDNTLLEQMSESKLISMPVPILATTGSKKYIDYNDDDDDDDRMLTSDEYERKNKMLNDKREEKRRREKKEKKEKKKEEKRKKRVGKLPPSHLAMTSLSPMPIAFGSNLPSLNSISSLSSSDSSSNSESSSLLSSSTIMTTTINTFDKTRDEKEEEKQEQQQQNSQNLYEKHKNCSKNPLRCSCRRPLNAPSRQTFPPFQETIIVPRSVTTLSTSSSSSPSSSSSSTLSGNKLSSSTSLKRNSFTDSIDFATSSAGGAITVGTN